MLLALACAGARGDTSPRPDLTPAILASTALSALPASLASGAAGPVNRFAIDLMRFDPKDPAATVECLYAGALRYRCRYESTNATSADGRRRVQVSVPDLNRGSAVTLRFGNTMGVSEVRVQLANPPQVIHEIEALPLPGGGREETDPQGKRVPALKLMSTQAPTTPEIALSMPPDRTECDGLYAQWNSVSATDAVFASRFGVLDGTVLLAKSVDAGGPVSARNLPLWLITYPAAATRVQFIAHYEVIYRVGLCTDRVVQ